MASAVCAEPLPGRTGSPILSRLPADLPSNTVFLAVDVETTGLSPRNGRIVELAAIRFSPGGPAEERSWLVNPGMPIPPSAIRVHGITDAMVASSPAIGAVLAEFLPWATGCVILAHQARFDLGFIEAEAARAGLPFQPAVTVDTLPLFRLWFPESDRHTLEALSTMLPREEVEGFHRALGDARLLRALFLLGLARESAPAAPAAATP